MVAYWKYATYVYYCHPGVILLICCERFRSKSGFRVSLHAGKQLWWFCVAIGIIGNLLRHDFTLFYYSIHSGERHLLMQSSLTSRDQKPAAQLGLNIRLARVRAGYSQEKLSELSGLSITYIGIVERGMKNITILNCQRLAAALGTSVCALLEGVFDS